MTSDELNETQQCPFLGTDDDSTTSYRFSTEENRCWRLGRSASVPPAHQNKYCFGGNYATCPVYTSGRAVAGVKVGRAPASLSPLGFASWRTILVVFEITLALIAGGALLYSWVATAQTPPTESLPIPSHTRAPTTVGVALLPTALGTAIGPTGHPTLLASLTAIKTSTPSPTATLTRTATLLPTDTPAVTGTLTAAPGLDQPVGPLNLVAHRVEENENLSSIAARFNTTVEIVRAVNGLSDQRIIQVGQVLVIPQGATTAEGLPKLVAFQTVQDTSLSIIVNQLSGDINLVRNLNALGDSDIVPAGRWLFIPQP